MDQGRLSVVLRQPKRDPLQQLFGSIERLARGCRPAQLSSKAFFGKKVSPALPPAVGLGTGADEVVALPAEASVMALQAAAVHPGQSRSKGPPGLGWIGRGPEFQPIQQQNGLGPREAQAGGLRNGKP